MLNDNETIIIWTPSTTMNEFGESKYTQTLVNCQVTEKTVNIIDSKGIETTADFVIRTRTNVNIDDLVRINPNIPLPQAMQTFDDMKTWVEMWTFDDANKVFYLQSSKPIKKREIVKNLNNKIEWYKIWV